MKDNDANAISRRSILLGAGAACLSAACGEIDENTSQATGASFNAGIAGFADYTLEYKRRDHELVEYSSYRLPELPGLVFRGPALDMSGDPTFFTALGAAQTYGVYAHMAYPQIVSHLVGVRSWNLGVGGAGPNFFLHHADLFPYINRGEFAVIQIMSARTEDNSRLQSTKLAHSVKDLKHGDIVGTHIFWQRVAKEEPGNLEKYIAESQETFDLNMRKIIAKIDVPVVSFWFSPKSLDAKLTFETSILGLMDVYPQFVFGRTLKYLGSDNPLVTCFSDRDMQFPLLSRFTGKPLQVDHSAVDTTGRAPSVFESENIYYPSQEMQFDAALVLSEEIKNRKLV